MKQLICLSNEPWSTSPGRTQQLVSRMKDTSILYFHPANSKKTSYPGGRTVRKHLTVYSLPPSILPMDERYGPLFRLGQDRLAHFIAKRAAHHRFRRPLLWTTCPSHVHLLDRLDYNGLVYDCDREWEDFPLDWEGALAASADVVFTVSPNLVDRLSPCSGNIALLPNGVTYPLFSQIAPPDAHSRLNLVAPVLGWVGTIHADLNLSPLLYAAQSRPNWTFLILGHQEDNPFLPRLTKLPNVRFHPPCPLVEIPEYLRDCQVLLNFLRREQSESDIVPTRIYEYLSTGLPIVSMLWPDQVEHFPDVVYGAHTSSEFLTLCEHALGEVSPWIAQRRRAHGANAAWSVRSREVRRILDVAGLL